MAFENTQMFDVDSSNVRRMGYDEDAAVLYVTFYNKKTGAEDTYWYAGVSPETWAAFWEAPSKGQFIWQNIRGVYEHGRL